MLKIMVEIAIIMPKKDVRNINNAKKNVKNDNDKKFGKILM